MENWQAWVAALTFIAVIFLIMTEWVHLTIAALLGALFLVFVNILTLPEAIAYIGESHATLGLFFGVMVLVRAFEPTGIFDYLATQMVLLARGKVNAYCWGLWGLPPQSVRFCPMPQP